MNRVPEHEEHHEEEHHEEEHEEEHLLSLAHSQKLTLTPSLTIIKM